TRARGSTVFGHGRGDRSRSRATPTQSRRIPTHEPERRRRLSRPAARAAPPASSRPSPQPCPSPRSPSPYASLIIHAHVIVYRADPRSPVATAAERASLGILEPIFLAVAGRNDWRLGRS